MNNALTACGQPPQFNQIDNTYRKHLPFSWAKLTMPSKPNKVAPTWEGSIMALHRLGESLGFA